MKKSGDDNGGDNKDDKASSKKSRLRVRSYKDYVREEILEATSRIIESEGINAATPTRIFAATGIARSTIYRHWPDKVELIDHAFRRNQALRKNKRSSPSGDAEKLVFASAAKFQDEHFLKMLASILGHADAHDAEEEGKWRELARDFANSSADALRNYIETLRRSGRLDTEFETEELLALVLGPVLYLQLLHSRPASEGFVFFLAKLLQTFVKDQKQQETEQA